MLYPITKHERKSSIRHIRNEGYVWGKKQKKFVEEPKVVISLIRHVKHDNPILVRVFQNKSEKNVSTILSEKRRGWICNEQGFG